MKPSRHIGHDSLAAIIDQVHLFNHQCYLLRKTNILEILLGFFSAHAHKMAALDLYTLFWCRDTYWVESFNHQLLCYILSLRGSTSHQGFLYENELSCVGLVGRHRPLLLPGRRSGIKPIHSFVLLVEFHQLQSVSQHTH